MDQVIKERLVKMLDESMEQCRLDMTRRQLSTEDGWTRRPFFKMKRLISAKLIYPWMTRLRVKLRARTFFGERILVPFHTFSLVRKYGVFSVSSSELRLTKFMVKNVGDHVVFFDLGANCGYYSLLIHAISQGSHVYAFEADPYILNVLKQNKRERITIVEKAVAESDGRIDFYSTLSHQSAFSTAYPHLFPTGKVKDYKKITVPAVSIDSFCGYYGVNPCFIKIDVEGAEENVLKGARNLLKNNSPLIAMEVWVQPFTENDRKALEILQSHGFQSYKITEAGTIKQIAYEDIPEYFDSIMAKNQGNDDIYPLAENMIFKK